VRLSRRATALPPSETLALSARAKALRAQGRPIIDLSAGEPDFAAPPAALRAARAGLDAGDTHYPPNIGTQELREAICARALRDHGARLDPARVIVSNGAKQSLYNLIHAVVDPGDEVVFAAPYWVSTPAMVELAGGVPKPVATRASEGFRLRPEELERALGPKTKCVVLNTPQNPTGAVYSPADVDAIVKLVFDRGAFLISDEIYAPLVFGDARHRSALEVAHPRSDELLLFVSGVSKMFAMTGFRVGWAHGPKDVIDGCARIQSHSTSGVCGISQRAAAAALRESEADTARMKEEFGRRLGLAVDGLRAIPGLVVPEPKGAFYVFPDVSALFGKEVLGERIQGSADVSRVLLEKADVAVVPGVAFGADAHVRISYALEAKDLSEAISRIQRALGSVVARSGAR
jgi:aspartate/methionine/tyrosine aminotransferase